MPENASTSRDSGSTHDGVLGRLSAGARARLRTIGRVVEFDRDATIIQEGADTPFLGLLQAGRVALRMRVPERGSRLTILTVEPGELLGWSALVAPYRATVDAVATVPTRLVAFESAALRRALATDAAVAAELPPLLLETVSRRLTASWTQLLDLFGAQDTQPW
jgi:CRP/FNR family transcriptional regulator, cyclic AMP receptor protein